MCPKFDWLSAERGRCPGWSYHSLSLNCKPTPQIYPCCNQSSVDVPENKCMAGRREKQDNYSANQVVKLDFIRKLD